jgi:hypothetical protein
MSLDVFEGVFGIVWTEKRKKLRKDKERKRNLCDTYAYDPFQTNTLEVERVVHKKHLSA